MRVKLSGVFIICSTRCCKAIWCVHHMQHQMFESEPREQLKHYMQHAKSWRICPCGLLACHGLHLLRLQNVSRPRNA